MVKYIVECKPDKHLIKILTKVSKKDIIHAGNKPEVLKQVLRIQEKCVGIIDEDPKSNQPPHLKEFELEKEIIENGLILLFKKGFANKKLIIIKPRLEEWLLKACEESDIDITKYNLSKNSNRLHKEINSNLSKVDVIVKKLLNLEKDNRVKALRKILSNISKMDF